MRWPLLILFCIACGAKPRSESPVIVPVEKLSSAPSTAVDAPPPLPEEPKIRYEAIEPVPSASPVKLGVLVSRLREIRPVDHGCPPGAACLSARMARYHVRFDVEADDDPDTSRSLGRALAMARLYFQTEIPDAHVREELQDGGTRAAIRGRVRIHIARKDDVTRAHLVDPSETPFTRFARKTLRLIRFEGTETLDFTMLFDATWE